nr:hypothetical protein REQ54_04738 [Rhizobium sp. Q54]
MTQDRNRQSAGENPNWANWVIPVVLNLQSRRQEVVSNPAEALSFLLVQWRHEPTDAHEEARAACSGVFHRRVSPEDARIAFIRFAQGAGLLD